MLPLDNTTIQPSQTRLQQKKADGLHIILDYIKVYISKWYWFALCVAIALVCCEIYLLVTPPQYTRFASIMIKNEQKEMNTNMRFLTSNIDVTNELFTLRSPHIAEETVRRLDLQTMYMSQGRFHEECVYGTILPVTIHVDSLSDNETFEMMFELYPDGTYLAYDFEKNGYEINSPRLRGKVGKKVRTPIGMMTVKPSASYSRQEIKLRIFHTSKSYATNNCMNRLSVGTIDEQSTIINLSYTDINPQLAEDVLSTIIAVYNENWVKDQNRVAISTSEFINERLGVIEQELGSVESNISSFKSANLIPASQSDVASIYIGQASTAQANITETSNQLYLARYVRNYLTNEANYYQLIPANQGISSAGISSQVSEYNNILLRRNNILAASSMSNPLVLDLDKQLASLRSAIIRSIDNHIQSLNVEMRTSQSVQAMSNSKIASSPKQAKYLLSVERQQKVKESLYLYLLQKREENELSQAFTAYNSRVITPASGSNEPTFPVHRTVWLVGILLGLAIPAFIISLSEALNTHVRGRRDIADLTIPFIGELPYAVHHKKLKDKIRHAYSVVKSLGKPEKEDKSLHIVVKPKSRNYINEAFRVIRTNLEFMTARGERSKIIMLSSFNPNSGKTFVATNLITSFAIKEKKVLAIDLDLRKASLSAMASKPKEGVSDYLSGLVDDYRKVIVKDVTTEGLDILPVGTIPPNPTELLFEPRLGEMLNELRKEYDYIFLDCPPVEIVADATIVGKHADMTLFILRADMIDKALLPEVQKYYDEQTLPKISVILNGTRSAFSYYGYHRYGYHRYGYGKYYSYGGYAHE